MIRVQSSLLSLFWKVDSQEGFFFEARTDSQRIGPLSSGPLGGPEVPEKGRKEIAGPGRNRSPNESDNKSVSSHPFHSCWTLVWQSSIRSFPVTPTPLDGQNRQSPIASVQRTRSTLASHSAVPAIRIAAITLASDSAITIARFRPSKPTPKTFSKVLPYKWEAYCSTNGRHTAVQLGGVMLGFPFFKA